MPSFFVYQTRIVFGSSEQFRFAKTGRGGYALVMSPFTYSSGEWHYPRFYLSWLLALTCLVADFPLSPTTVRAQDDLLRSVEDWAKENLDEDVLLALGQVDRDRVTAVLNELQNRLKGESVYELAPLKAQAESLLPILEQFEETAALADWLRVRLDDLTVAEALQRAAPPKPTNALRPAPTLQLQRSVWVKQLEKREIPPRAKAYLPMLKSVFATGKVPEELVWLAEVESAFNPKARSPAGAEGMFQLMKPTAKRFGLSTFLPDERRNPEKSARAAASYLRFLYGRFGDWRLALAAYNAGEGRIDSILKKAGTRNYQDIVSRLPAETQLYVPKYEATLKKREGLTLEELKSPKN